MPTLLFRKKIARLSFCTEIARFVNKIAIFAHFLHNFVQFCVFECPKPLQGPVSGHAAPENVCKHFCERKNFTRLSFCTVIAPFVNNFAIFVQFCDFECPKPLQGLVSGHTAPGNVYKHFCGKKNRPLEFSY